ncbi:MAG: helix-turn-helix domain-containing protein, partial [Myxococcales bacterium]|nr:helix-turn-helix domain-containing protein [Myxococcales bacterium]
GIAAVTSFLRERLPPPDPNVALVARTVAAALEDRTLVTVEALAARAGLAPRTLQRLFRRYVGVGPKWMIRRFRMHEAAERLARGALDDGASLART